MERDDLVHARTSAVAEGRDKPVLKPTIDQPRPIVMDPAIAEKHLEFERYKLEQEIKFSPTTARSRKKQNVAAAAAARGGALAIKARATATRKRQNVAAAKI